MELDLNYSALPPLTGRDYANMQKAADFVRRSAEEWYIEARRKHGHSRLTLEPVVLKPMCDDCLSRLGMPTFLERALNSRRESEIVPLLPIKVRPDRLRFYDCSNRLVHLYPYKKRPYDWYRVECSDCSQRVDSREGDDVISVYEVPFADYFGLPEPEDAPKGLRGKAKRREQERVLALYGGRCFECRKKLKIGKNLTLDHIVPRSRGGTWLTTNLQPFCHDCQQKKADLPVEVIKIALDMLLRPPPSESYDGPVW
jgi:5-methylcytosine-specific restriction endonuclease McrA